MVAIYELFYEIFSSSRVWVSCRKTILEPRSFILFITCLIFLGLLKPLQFQEVYLISNFCVI